MVLLRNIKRTLHKKETKKVFHDALNMEFTITTLPPDIRSQVASLVNNNPLEDEVKTPIERDREINVLYISHGIVELEGNEELGRQILNAEGLGASNKIILEEIRKVNPDINERIKDLFIIMAFSPEEVRLIDAVMDVEAKRELAFYLSDEEDVIKAINFCKEFFMALGTAHAIAQEHRLPTEGAFLILAKPILAERKLLPPEEIAKMPDMPQANVQVNVQQPR